MKRLIVLLLGALALCLPPAPAAAQQGVQYLIVTSCGGLAATPPVGTFYWGTMTPDGKFCDQGSNGGGGASYTAEVAPFSVSAGVNKPAGIDTANSAQFTELCIPSTTTCVDPTAPSYVKPTNGATTQTNSTVTTHGTFQTALAAATRLGCAIVNTSADTELIFFGANGSATTSNAIPVLAGQSISCAMGVSVSNDNVSITSKNTDGATYVVVSR